MLLACEYKGDTREIQGRYRGDTGEMQGRYTGDTCAGMLLACEYKTEAQQRMEQNLGLNEYVSGFSVVLGVYMFGAQGVVFGPGLVCGIMHTI